MVNNIAANDLIKILLIIIILIGAIAIGYLVNRIIVLSKSHLDAEKAGIQQMISWDVNMDCNNHKNGCSDDWQNVFNNGHDGELTLILGIDAETKHSFARLIFLEEEEMPSGRTELLIKKTTVLGREADVDIKISDMAVSKHHAKIVFAEDKLWLEDLNSANGTYLNNHRVISKTPILDGDVVKIGMTSFSVQMFE